MSALIQILLHQLLGSLQLPVTVQGNHLDSRTILHHLVETTMALNDRRSIFQARNLNNGTFSIQFTGKKAGYFPTRFYIIATDGSCIMGCLYLSVEENNRDMRTISSLDGRCYIIHVIRGNNNQIYLPGYHTVYLTSLTLPVILCSSKQQIHILILILRQSHLIIHLLAPNSATTLRHTYHHILLGASTKKKEHTKR